MIIGKTRTNQPVEPTEGFVDGVADIIESGEVDNAKPLYYHSMDIYDSTNKNCFLFEILNNNNTPIDSIEDLIAWAEGTGASYLELHGSGVVKISGVWYHLASIFVWPDTIDVTKFKLLYLTDSGYVLTDYIEDLTDYFTTYEDMGVNKLN